MCNDKTWWSMWSKRTMPNQFNEIKIYSRYSINSSIYVKFYSQNNWFLWILVNILIWWWSLIWRAFFSTQKKQCCFSDSSLKTKKWTLFFENNSLSTRIRVGWSRLVATSSCNHCKNNLNIQSASRSIININLFARLRFS